MKLIQPSFSEVTIYYEDGDFILVNLTRKRKTITIKAEKNLNRAHVQKKQMNYYSRLGKILIFLINKHKQKHKWPCNLIWMHQNKHFFGIIHWI